MFEDIYMNKKITHFLKSKALKSALDFIEAVDYPPSTFYLLSTTIYFSYISISWFLAGYSSYIASISILVKAYYLVCLFF